VSFDDRIRDALGSADRAYEPGQPPTAVLAANVARRRRRRALVASTGAAAAIALIVGLAVTLPDDSGGRVNVETANGGTTPSADATIPGTDQTTTTTNVIPPTTSAAVSASAGTAYAPPASVVYPKATTSTASHPTTTATAPAGDTVMVTEEDNGKTFTLRPGQHLVVTLDDSSSIWSDPETDNAAVLSRTAVSANPSATHVTASFDAKSAGQAHVSASKDLPCRNAQPPCMAPTQLWQITVTVQP
jgi:hypothetical protein